MEIELYTITQKGLKVDLSSPTYLPEEKMVLEALSQKPFTIYGIMTYVSENKKTELTHYKTKQILSTFKEKGFVEIRQ